MIRLGVAALTFVLLPAVSARSRPHLSVPTLSIEVRTPDRLRAQRGEYLAVVGTGAAAGGAHFVPIEGAAAVEAGLHGVLDIERDESVAYRIALRLVGPGAPAGGRCVSEATGGAPDLLFGAILATEVAEFARCARSGSPAVR